MNRKIVVTSAAGVLLALANAASAVEALPRLPALGALEARGSGLSRAVGEGKLDDAGKGLDALFSGAGREAGAEPVLMSDSRDANPNTHENATVGAVVGAISGSGGGAGGVAAGAAAGAIGGAYKDIKDKEKKDEDSYRRGNEARDRDRRGRGGD